MNQNLLHSHNMHLVCVLLPLLLQHLKTGQGQRAIVSISPVTEFTPGTSALTVRCSPSGSGVNQYDGITLYHNDSQNTMTETQVATVYYSVATTSNDASLASPYSSRQGVEATGAVTPLGSAQLSVTFDATSTLCGDAGTYRCEVKGKDSNNADFTWGGMASISARVIPTAPPTLTIQSNSFPSFPDVMADTRYAVGTVLTLTCSGQIGGDPNLYHRWCWQQLGSNMNPSLTGYPFGSHINQGTPTKSGCQYSRTSTLTYNVTAADTNTMFTCEDGAANTLMCGSGTFSANVTIRNSQGQRAIVSISPVTEFTPGTRALTITCSPSGSGVRQYEGITLYHNDSQSTMTESQVATVHYSIATTSNVVVLSPPYSSRSRVQATGAVTPLGSAQLQVTFDATSTLCGDAGTYRCEVKGKDTNNADFTLGGMASISAKVIATAPPTLTIQSNSFPSFPEVSADTKYAVGTVLTLTCSGEIGGDPNVEHRWCWQQMCLDMNNLLTGYPFPSRINQGTPTKSGCQYSRTSTLTYNVTAADTNTMFTCEDGAANTFMCGSGTFSANVTIRKMIPSVPHTLSVKSNSVPSFPNDTTDTKYAVGTLLTLTCSGVIGDNPNVEHRWCWQQLGSSINDKFTVYTLKSHISQGTLTKSGCQYRRASTLTYNVTTADTNTVFACEDDAPGTLICGSNTYTANVTIRIIKTERVTDPEENNSSEKGNTVFVAVIVICSVITVVSITLAIVAFNKEKIIRQLNKYSGKGNTNAPSIQIPNNSSEIYQNNVEDINEDPQNDKPYMSLNAENRSHPDHMYCSLNGPV